MATVTFIRNTKQGAGALHGVSRYVSQDKKTDSGLLVNGQNCSPQFAAREFIATRQMHRKDSPVYFYQYVQSFSPEENISAALAHEVAKEFAASAWPESEVLIATHIDAEHIHSHFVINALCFETGRMLRQGPDTLRRLRQISDEICLAHGLSVLPKQPKQTQNMGTREYRAAARGESWKLRLMATVDECVAYARTKDEFIALMRSEGYEVKWEPSRKSITYTCPNGQKCRDNKLHEEKYLKENMEHEFRIREEIIYGRAEAVEPAADTGTATGASSHRGGVGNAAAADTAHRQASIHNEQSVGTAAEQADGRHDMVTGRGNAEAAPRPDTDGPTGWETERETLLSPKAQTAAYQTQPHPAACPGHPAGVLGNVVELGYAVERNQDTAPMRDTTSLRPHIDSKALAKQRAKKIALGHKPDDHENQQQQMY